MAELSTLGSVIKTAYEGQANTNAFTDAEQTKLAGIDAIASLKSNLAAAVDPTVNEDSGDGYAVGSRWVNTTDDKEFVCLDATLGAAVWIETTGVGSGPVEGTAVLSTGEVGGTKFLREDGDGTCSWQVPAGSGDVSKVGTPVNNQVGVWTGDGTIEGDAGLTFDGTALTVAQVAAPAVLTLNPATELGISLGGVSNYLANTSGLYPVSDGDRFLGLNLKRWSTIYGDNLHVNDYIYFSYLTNVSGLPDPATQGLIYRIDDAVSAEVGTIVAGGGSNFALVVSDGFNWRILAGIKPTIEGTAVLSTGEVGGTKFLREDGDGTCSWQAVPAAGLQNVVEDLTPQLGGSLDVNGQKIVSVTNGNIDIEPHGTGNVLLGNFTLDADQAVGVGQDNYVLTYDNASGLISLEAAAGGTGDFKADGSVDMTGQFRTDVGTFDSDVVDGASANAYTFDTQNTYSTAGANLLRLSNNADVMMDFSFQGGIDHVNSGASTAAHSQSLNLNWSATTTQTSSGQYSVVLGNNNTASSTNGVAIGATNAVSRNTSVAIGSGNTITTSGTNQVIIGTNSVSQNFYAMALGYWASAPHSSLAYASGRFSAAGDAQTITTVARVSTTDATQTTLINGDSGNNIVIPADTSWAFSALVIARSDETDGNESAAYRLEGLLIRDESNNTAIVGSVTKTVIAESAGAAAWDVTAEADNTNEALAIKVTGEAATNIRWVAKVDISQVTYA